MFWERGFSGCLRQTRTKTDFLNVKNQRLLASAKSAFQKTLRMKKISKNKS